MVLQTNGSISRAVTVGNNQNTVLNSNLDLQVSGKLSDQVTLRASYKTEIFHYKKVAILKN